jgi:hypothetical protein
MLLSRKAFIIRCRLMVCKSIQKDRDLRSSYWGAHVCMFVFVFYNTTLVEAERLVGTIVIIQKKIRSSLNIDSQMRMVTGFADRSNINKGVCLQVLQSKHLTRWMELLSTEMEKED